MKARIETIKLDDDMVNKVTEELESHDELSKAGMPTRFSGESDIRDWKPRFKPLK